MPILVRGRRYEALGRGYTYLLRPESYPLPGKTTTLRSITGLTPPRRGRILYNGTDITRRALYYVAKLGIGFVPEDRRIFPDLTVFENFHIGRKPSRAGSLNGPWSESMSYSLFLSSSKAGGREDKGRGA